MKYFCVAVLELYVGARELPSTGCLAYSELLKPLATNAASTPSFLKLHSQVITLASLQS